jgi:hypothetical protein
MSAWIGVVASYLPEILQLAKPLFTRAKPQEKTPDVLEKQIVELQNAATQNAEAIKKLALDMQHTIDALQTAAASLERRLRRVYLVLCVSVAIAAVAVSVAVAAYASSLG